MYDVQRVNDHQLFFLLELMVFSCNSLLHNSHVIMTCIDVFDVDQG